jgi:hypothetical protein
VQLDATVPGPRSEDPTCSPVAGRRLRARVDGHAVHHVAARVDRTAALAAIELLGASAGRLLKALGVYGTSGDPRAVSPFTAAKIAGIEASWLLQSERRAVALVATDRAGDLWQHAERAVRPLGVSCVGIEAASRYALLERSVQLSTL